MNHDELEKIWFQIPPDYYEEGIMKNLLQKLWHTRKWIVIRKMINNKSGEVLDVGCASGWLTARISKLLPEAKVVGLDISRKMIECAKNKYPKVNFVCADAHKIPFPDEKFNLIICTETLEHVVDPLGVLLEMKRCLNLDGRVIVSMDTGNVLFNLIWFFWTRTKGRVWRGAHLHKFNIQKLKNLFKKASFKIESQRISHLGLAVTFELRKS